MDIGNATGVATSADCGGRERLKELTHPGDILRTVLADLHSIVLAVASRH